MASNKELKFSMQRQVQDNWCWAANAASISIFYDNHSGWTQCLVATDVFPGKSCCVNAAPCNEPWYLDEALQITSNFNAPLIYSPINLAEIKAQVDNGRLIGTRIGWSGGGGHFVSIYGYNDIGQDPFLYIADPIYGNSFVKLSSFNTSYQNNGRWTHTYYTQQNGDAMIKFSKVNKALLEKAATVKLKMASSIKGLEALSNNNEGEILGQEVYFLNLSTLTNELETPLKGGYRVFTDNGSEKLIYEFDGNEPSSTLQQVIHDNNFNKVYQKSLNKIKSKQTNTDENYVLRVLRLPELKLEAFWLHNDQNSEFDQYIPVFNTGKLKANMVYPKLKFFNLLRVAEQQRKKYDDPLLGG
ncbi:MAG: hypothetical protein EOO91_12995 [Pedobacter sp.]|nr:MAG: hypothetical protein EOO91_12995 [Pedobacter sp.]